MSQSWSISVLDGPDQGRSFQVSSERPLIIGRGSTSDTQIRDASLSRIHCEVRMEDGSLVLQDRGSTSGTFVGGVPIEGNHRLTGGNVITIGETRLRVDTDSTLDARTIVREPQPAAKPLSSLIGEMIQEYRLQELVKTGASSAIFKALDTNGDTPVAIKVLMPQLASTDDQRERFVRAMHTMLPIRHPSIVRLLKAGRQGPYCWAALEWIDGVSVADLIQKIGISGMLPWRQVWKVGANIGEALAAASEHGIIHRNITPSNILRRNSDNAFLLTDLVLARALDTTDATQLTRPGDVIGDLGYMPPERVFDATQNDERSDQYGLGATMYALLTGKPPFEASGIADLIDKIQTTVPKPACEVQMGVDGRFSDLVSKMIQRSPDERFESPRELLNQLERVAKLAGMT